jgi:hypothetical protein
MTHDGLGASQPSVAGSWADPIPAQPVEHTIVVEMSADTDLDMGRWRHATGT